MRNRKTELIIIVLTSLFVIAGILIMFGGNLFSGLNSKIRSDVTVMPEATSVTAEIKKGTVVEQTFRCDASSISKIGIVFTKEYDAGNASVKLELYEGNDLVASNTYAVSSVPDQHRTYLIPDKPISSAKGKKYTLKICSANETDTGLKLMASYKVKSTYKFGNKDVKGTICFSVTE